MTGSLRELLRAIFQRAPYCAVPGCRRLTAALHLEEVHALSGPLPDHVLIRVETRCEHDAGDDAIVRTIEEVPL